MRLLACLATALLAVVALSGCQTTEIDAAVQKSLPQICSAATTVQPALLVAESAGKLTGKTAAAVDAAYASLAPLCASPGTQTAATALVAATTAYLTITAALKQAQKAT
jgi:hypothetical protein